MTKLGECLVFYLKYPVEMHKLEDGTELEGLEDPEGTRKMAEQVSVKSRTEAAEFLKECGNRVLAHFQRIGNLKIGKEGPNETAAKIEKKWSLSYGIWPADKKKPAAGTWKMKTGVDLKEVQPGKFEVIPWLWRKDGEAGEDHLAFILKDAIKVRVTAKDVADWEPGTIALARLPLSVPPDASDVRCEELLAGVDGALLQITKTHFEHCYP
jgi:hypothetical protein